MKTLKDLLRKGEPVTGQEMTINIESVRIPPYRESLGSLEPLGDSIQKEGIRHPIAVWTDGTLVSGARRLRAHFLLPGQKYRQIRAVFVDTIEDAAKRLLIDNGDEEFAKPYGSAEMCRLWEVLRQLDEPAAARRADEARRRGVELRRLTAAGARQPGRSASRGKGAEYVMQVLAEPFGISEITASRLWTIYSLSCDLTIPDSRREQARNALASIDRGETSIWANYSRLISRRVAPSVPKQVVPVDSAPATRQRATWERSLPMLEGLTNALTELGPPNPELTWEHVGPVHAQLMKIRRDLEKIIKNMKETAEK